VAKGIDGPGLAMMGVGAILVYAGAKGYSLLALAQNAVKGHPLHEGVAMSPLSSDDATGVDSGLGVAAGSPREVGKSTAVLFGWSGADWDALDKLWTRESGWNPKAENKSSGAYGIPQALPYTKMPKSAWPERYGGQSDAATQIQWGLSYIKGRYGTPRMAWAHETSNGWY